MTTDDCPPHGIPRPHDPCCTCGPCDDARFRTAPAVLAVSPAHLERVMLATGARGALTTFNRGAVKR
jgi:hypothetical protein